MSGPISATFVLGQGALLLAERAIREAQAMKREYAEVVRQMRAREDELAQTARAQQAARLERMAALRRESERQSSRFERLRALADTLASPRNDLMSLDSQRVLYV